ncbi:MAG: CPBP family intramembrane metalloprotease [Planctomycetales bacterium]|nr:CPBP family intramembrane metalloprotease [Planctomycetales bacterium]
MPDQEDSPVNVTRGPGTTPARWTMLALALSFPTLITWLYFDVLAGSAAMQPAYLVGKTVQFLLPVIWVVFVARDGWQLRRPSTSGAGLGLAFGAAVCLAGGAVYFLAMRHFAYFDVATEVLRGKLDGAGITTPLRYVLLATFYSLFHSALEEYYWRWFVLGRLMHTWRLWPAAVVSSLGFMAHHVLLLESFFTGRPELWLPLSLAIAVGGVFWAWLYRRSDSLVGPWLSHLVIDAGIMVIGYDLLFVRG